VGWYDRSIKTRLGIALGFVVVVAAGVGGLFLATGGAELLFGPTVPVTFSTIDGQPEYRHVILTGELSLPGTEAIYDDRQQVFLSDPANPGRHVGVDIKVPQAGATVAPNQMGNLPLVYSDADLLVRLADGSYADHGDLVRVTGTVRSCTDRGLSVRCINADVIEAAE
jgi:hypothetical protein